MSEQTPGAGTIRVVDLPEADREFIQAELRRNTPLHHLLALEIVEIGGVAR